MKFFFGVDVGSSKTHALIADETGKCVGFGKAKGGNHQNMGYEEFARVLHQSFKNAQEMSGVNISDIAGAGFGVAGYDFPSDKEPHMNAIASLGLNCPIELVNDGMNGLVSGTSHGIGVNVTAGSSNNCRGRNKNGKEGRIVGNGSAFGEYGGGLEIAMRALHMANYAWIKRIPPTSLTKILLDATGARDEMDLMEGVSNDYYPIVPAIAIAVIDAARQGDAAAHEIVQSAGEELGWLAISVARQIEMDDQEVEIIQSGSIFNAGEIITQPMYNIIIKYLPKAKLIRLDGPPVAGPLMLAMQAAGLDPYPLRKKIIDSTKRMRDNTEPLRFN